MPDMSLDLGVIGNAAAAALIDRDARLVWMCAPRMDGDPVFCRLLGGEDVATADESGDWTFAVEKHAQSRQSYVRNTAILETILEDEDGNALRVTDFAPRFGEAIAALAQWLASGEVKVRMDIHDGLENALATLKTLYTGGNTGKLLLRVAAP